MKKDDISRLLNRYLTAQQEGKEAYFDADEIDDLLNSLEESDDFTNYDEVLALGLKLHPANTELKIRQCRQYIYNDDIDSALELLQTLNEVGNQDLDLVRLECFCSIDRFDDVMDYTNNLIATGCDYMEVVFEYITPILSELDMLEEAQEYLALGLSLFPDNQTLLDELCYCLEEEGDIQEAIKVCNTMIDKNPYSNDNWFTLGRLYSSIADFDKAIEAFDFALTCDDSDNELKMLKAYCLYMNENYEKAIETYSEVTKMQDDSIHIPPLIAECYMKLDDYDKAYQTMKEFIDTNGGKSEGPSMILNYVRCCMETDRNEEALHVLKEAADEYPENVRILSMLALSYMESNNEPMMRLTTTQLLNLFEKIEKETPDDWESLFQAAQFLYLKGDSVRALKYYEKLLKQNPAIPYMHIHIAMAYLALGDVEQFNEHYQKSSEEEIVEYLSRSGLKINKEQLRTRLLGKPVPPNELIRDFFDNKDNKN